jgi:GLPGLI family protein
MKRNICLGLITVLSCLLSVAAFAQKSIEEGKIVYEISFPENDFDEQTLAMLPTQSTMFFKGSFSRTELSMAMGMENASIYDGKSGKVTTLTNMMGNKTYMTMDDSQGQEKVEKPEIVNTDETKTIAGYLCKKSIMKMKDGSTMELYHTDKISSNMSGVPNSKELGGFPLEFSINQMGFKMKFIAQSVTAEKVSDDLFKVPGDYKFVTPEDMRKMYGGGN